MDRVNEVNQCANECCTKLVIDMMCIEAHLSCRFWASHTSRVVESHWVKFYCAFEVGKNQQRISKDYGHTL